MVIRKDISDIENIWNSTFVNNGSHAPFFTHAWHRLWFEVLGKDWEPYLLVIDDVVVAPFAKKNNEVIFSGGAEISDYQDLVGPHEKKQETWQQILEHGKNDGVTSFHFRNIPESSPTVSFFQKFSHATVAQENTTPTITLPATWDAHIESLPYKERHELRRKLRKIEKEHHNPTIAVSTDPARDITILLDLMRHDAEKQAFLTPDMTVFFQKIASTFAADISLLILYMGDKPSAATLSFIADQSYMLYNSGFDKECCPYAGFYLKAMSIKYALDKGLKEYNFLQGSERYKYDLGGRDRFVYSVALAL
mgnify:FL=1